MLRSILIVVVALTATLHAGCGGNNPDPKPADDKSKPAAKDKLLLTSEPAGAKGVIEVKKQTKEGEEVVVVGRIGGSTKPFTGRAAFTIVDPSFLPCNEKGDDKCTTPWDYCCDPAEDLAKGTVLIKFVDEAGKTLADDAKALLGLKELQTVVVRGQARRDEGSFSIVATGLFIKK